MDSAELDIHRENTAWYIAANPTDVVLIPKTERQRTASGGYTEAPGTPRSSQTFRIIEPNMNTTPPVIKLQDGRERKAEFMLLGLWDAACAIGDSWTAADGRVWEIGDIVHANNYETRALVAEHGR